jgi:hypothetical protein
VEPLPGALVFGAALACRHLYVCTFIGQLMFGMDEPYGMDKPADSGRNTEALIPQSRFAASRRHKEVWQP